MAKTVQQEKEELAIEQKVKGMTSERYQEIKETLKTLNLGTYEMSAWLKINKKLNTFGDKHKFA